MTVDEIVARHLQARGGAARLRAVQSVVYRNGTFREGSYTGSGRSFMAMARPYYKIVGDPTDPRATFREGYDGSAWEWYRSPGIVIRTVGAPNAAIRFNLDPDGPFSDYRRKGSSIERLADEHIAGRQAYALRLTLRDGARALYLIDRETFLIAGARQTAPVHAFGAPVTSEERYSDYRTVDGILFPFRATQTDVATGREMSSMQWGAIEVNRDLPREWFSPPQFVRTPLQDFLEHLYYQRSDTTALHWSYAAFRGAHADVDTREGIEAIGYQMLKTGDHAGAITVLRLNAQDYPRSSSALYELGRAFATAADTSRALHALQRAVQLDPDNRRAADAIRALQPTRDDSSARGATVLIPAGSFVMGTDMREIGGLLARYGTRRRELFASEVPRRTVDIHAFRMDRTEVTKSAFREFLRALPLWQKDALPITSHNGRYLEDWHGTEYPAGEDKRPVTYVTWEAARAYCAWSDGRLPSEAEWEYVASGGLTRPEFPWGDTMPDSARANWSRSGLGRPVDVAQYPPNGYGLYDMAGNVWEFLADRWPTDAVGALPDNRESRYALRGGSFGASAINLRVRYRDSHAAGNAAGAVGFRCAYSP